MKTLRYWGPLTGAAALVLLAAFTLVGGSLAESQPAVHAPQRIVASNTAAQQRGGTLPAGLVSIVARTLAARSPDTWRAHVTKQAVVFNNPAQHLTASFSYEGTQLQFSGEQHAQLGMQLLALRRGNASYPMTATMPSAHDNRVELNHGHGLTEWYINSPLGVEQGFTIAAPPKSAASSQSLTLVFKLSGNLKPQLKDDALTFQNTKDQTVLRYGNLLAYDARHHALLAHMQLTGSRLLLHVSTEGAHYPITVDPLFSHVTSFTEPSAAGGDEFGYAVALSGDGNTALVGTPSGLGTIAGVVYVYTQSNGAWSTSPIHTFNDPAAIKGDSFGDSVALSSDGTTALIGASNSSSTQGLAYLYTRNSSGAWSATPTFTFTDPANTKQDYFGNSVSLSADGETALIGADGTALPGTSTTAGAAYVFTQSNGAWFTTPTASYYDPAPAASGNQFGYSIALSADGSTALISAYQTTLSNDPAAGTAYVYVQSNGSWPSTPTQSINDPAPVGADDFFGSSVAVSQFGTEVLIGAEGKSVSGNSGAGTAYMYTESNGTWSATPSQTFSDPPPSAAADFFGASVGLSADGQTALIGASGTTVNSITNAGAAYVYLQSNGTWPSTPDYSTNDPNVTGADEFGYSTALSSGGGTALVGAFNATVSSNGSAGAAYVLASSADLSLALASNPASVNVSDSVTYMFTVTNNDTQVTATGLTLTDTLPSGMTFISAPAANGTCTNSSGTVTCALASLAPEATWQPSIVVTATSAGSIKNSASVAGNQSDPNTANNTATVTTTVTATAPPTVTNGSVTTTAGTAVNGALTATGTGTLTFAIVAQPKNGSVKLTDVNIGDFTYTPNNGFTGTDSFTFTVSDSSGGTSNTATETVTVNAAGGGGSSGGGSSGGGSSGGGSSGGGGGGFDLLSLLLLTPLVRLGKRKV